MNIYRMKYLFLSGAMALLASLAITSCDDANDWDVDSSHDRLFSSNKVAVVSSVFDAEVTFTTTPNTEYYIIELSADSLYDAVPMGSTGNSVIIGEDKSVTSSPYTLKNLKKETKYYLRIKSMSQGKSSHWSYPEKFSFTTKMEQIMGEVVRKTRSVVLNWAPNTPLTSIEVNSNNGTRSIDISGQADVLASGTYEVTELQPMTVYTIYLKNGDDIKGYTTVQTYADVPVADKVYELAASDVLSQDYINMIAADMNASASNLKTATITLAAGARYVTPIGEDGKISKIAIPDGLSVNFYGIPGGEKASVTMNSLDVTGTHALITFGNLVVSGVSDSNMDYLINQATDCNIGLLSFDECELVGFNRSFIRLQASTTKIFNRITINNSLVHGIGSGNYSFIQAKGGEGTIYDLEITNSTFYAFAAPVKSFLSFESNNDMEKLLVSDCTFYNVVGDGQYFIDFKENTYGAKELIIRNCIMGKTLTDKTKGGRAKSWTVQDSYKTTDWYQASNAIEGFTDYAGKATDLFTDPENGDFTVKDPLFDGYNKAGDPRWYKN